MSHKPLTLYLGGQLGAADNVLGKEGVVLDQSGHRLADTGRGIGSGLGQLGGQGGGLLHLLLQLPHLGDGLHEAAVGDLGLRLVVVGGGANGGLHVDDVVAGVDDLQVGVDQVGDVLAGGHSAQDNVRVELLGTGLDPDHPVDDAAEALDGPQGGLEGAVRGAEDAEVLLGLWDAILYGWLWHHKGIDLVGRVYYLQFDSFSFQNSQPRSRVPEPIDTS